MKLSILLFVSSLAWLVVAPVFADPPAPPTGPVPPAADTVPPGDVTVPPPAGDQIGRAHV